eukprot:scaffold115665_cov32-Tisochrysis_lutea.AAC.1
MPARVCLHIFFLELTQTLPAHLFFRPPYGAITKQGWEQLILQVERGRNKNENAVDPSDKERQE